MTPIRCARLSRARGSAAALLLAATIGSTGCSGPGPVASAGSPGAGAGATAAGSAGPVVGSGRASASARSSPSPTGPPTVPPGVLAIVEGDGTMRFDSPNGIAIDGAGHLLVHDSGNFRIVRLDPSGAPLGAFGRHGPGSGDFAFLGFGGVAVDGERILVVDNGTRSVKTFDAAGAFQSAFGSPGSGAGQLLRPVYVAVGPAPERLRYVTDDRKPSVEVFDRTGAFRFAFGGDGPGEGQFRHQTGIAVAADGTVAVADYVLSRIQLFDGRGRFRSVVSGPGGSEGHLEGPDGIAVDAVGRWYVSDTSNHRIDVFAPDGGALGSVKLAFTTRAAAPAGLAVATDGSIWVADPHANVVVHLARPSFLPA